jgi:hypothetical protein
MTGFLGDQVEALTTFRGKLCAFEETERLGDQHQASYLAITSNGTIPAIVDHDPLDAGIVSSKS